MVRKDTLMAKKQVCAPGKGIASTTFIGLQCFLSGSGNNFQDIEYLGPVIVFDLNTA